MTDTDQTEPAEQDDFGGPLREWTPREEAAAATRYLTTCVLCAAGKPWVGDDQLEGSEHGHSLCWAVGVILKQNLALTAWIRENRGRLHRPTCLDGNGCRCGLGDLPMWGGAGVPEMPT